MRRPKRCGCGAPSGKNHPPRCIGAREQHELAFLRGASWAYQELTGAVIVPASFEEQAREAATERKEKP